MILQALYQLYQRRQRDADPARRLPEFGLEDAPISFAIEISAAGQLIQVIDRRVPMKGRLLPLRFLVPLGAERSVDISPSLLWDNVEYAIGIPLTNKPDRVAKQHLAFVARIEALPPHLLEDEGVSAVRAFLRSSPEQLRAQLERSPHWEDMAASNPNVAFQLSGDQELVCQRPAVIAIAEQLVVSKGSVQGQCLISGEFQDIARLHGKIAGVVDPGGQAWKPLVSVNDGESPAFRSYGKASAFNAPVGERSVFAYTTALNALLGASSRNKVRVGDASTVFWADETHPFDGEHSLADLFGEGDNPDRHRDAVQALYQAVRSGTRPIAEDDTRFFVLGLAPNAARLSVRFWLPGLPFAELAPRLAQHFDDIALKPRFDSDPPHPSLFRLLCSLALQGKADNVPPRLAGEWMRSILEARPLPAGLLNTAVQRCKAERDVPYLRACVLKAWLNRQARQRGEPGFKEELDMQNDSAAYRLGRLFATLERIQEQAQPGINATIRDRYYGAASTTPVAVFTTLLRLKNAHLKKLSEAFGAYFEKLIGEILAPVTAMPRQLTLQQQGEFALGYYHQRQAFFTKKPAEPDTDPQGDPA